MNEANCNEYRSEAALRLAVEQNSGRSLNNDEWLTIAPDWSEPYGDLDVAELVRAVRDTLPQQNRTSLQEAGRVYRRAHVERAALEAREMVEASRIQLFGSQTPPFPNLGIEAAQWIEAQAEKPGFKRFGIEVTVPGQLGQFESLIWLRDYLNQHLSRISLGDGQDDSSRFKQFLEECTDVRSLNGGKPILAYLGVNPEGEINIKRVYAPDGTLLGLLQDRAQELAKAADWEPYAAVHHLLTGGIIAPLGVQTSAQYRGGRKVFGDTHSMTLKIADPDSVTEQDLVAAFRKERTNTAPPWNQHWNQQPRQRARIAPKSERVAAFVEATPGLTWKNRIEKWNQKHPNDRFRTISAMKKAHSRAKNR